MSQTQTVSKTKKHLLREEEADRDLRHTEYGRFVPIFLTLILLATVFPVALAQVIDDRSHIKDRRPIWRRMLTTLSPRRTRLLPDAGDIRSFEGELDRDSVLTDVFLPDTQLVLTALGAGNEQVVPGRGRRLFYHRDYEYVAGAGFLDDPGNRRTLVGDVVSVSRQLRERGISFIFLPVPPATVFYPELFTGSRFTIADAPIQNRSWDELKSEMARNGIDFLDLTPVLTNLKNGGTDPWMPQDSHWTPAGMDAAARAVSQAISLSVPLPPVADPGYSLGSRTIRMPGDLCGLLHLARNNPQYPEMTYTIQPIHTRDGALLSADPGGDVLIIGDSLSDKFDDSATGVGASLVQRCSFYLKRPVDHLRDPEHRLSPITYAMQSIAANPSLLDGKRVVVWETNARALIEADKNWGDVTFPAKAANRPAAPGRSDL